MRKNEMNKELNRLSLHYNWTNREKQRVAEYAKQEAIEFFKWYAVKMMGFIEYIKDIRPTVTSNEIEEKIKEFEGKPIDDLYELYKKSNQQ